MCGCVGALARRFYRLARIPVAALFIHVDSLACARLLPVHWIDVRQRFATGPIFKLPTFSYAGPELHYSDNTVLLGDTIHAVKVRLWLWLRKG